uniref:Uncharacterized protein n=1 Tax=Oryza nivara TaxID=4536 RepID=A0A0E0FWY2_ORYNI
MAPPSQRHANDDLENGIRVPLLEVPKIEESHCCPCFWLPISCLTNVPKAVKNWLVARIGDMLPESLIQKRITLFGFILFGIASLCPGWVNGDYTGRFLIEKYSEMIQHMHDYTIPRMPYMNRLS